MAAADEPHDLGRRIYNQRCYFCHGYAGDGKTLASRFLDPPPRDFTRLRPDEVSRTDMIGTVTRGRPTTAMRPFAGVLPPKHIAAVVDFVRSNFMLAAGQNTRYHTTDNGWPDHQRYRDAFPFAKGELAIDTPWESLTGRQRSGLRLYFTGCISCHDRARVERSEIVWERQALSYPRFGFRPGDHHPGPDAVTGATPFARHDVPVRIEGLSPLQREGEALFLSQCAFCHGADGTGQNWIGRFLVPHPRNLTDPVAMRDMTPSALRRVIREGMPGTSMPAWGSVLNARQIESLVVYIARSFHPLRPDAGPASGNRQTPSSSRPESARP